MRTRAATTRRRIAGRLGCGGGPGSALLPPSSRSFLSRAGHSGSAATSLLLGCLEIEPGLRLRRAVLCCLLARLPELLLDLRHLLGTLDRLLHLPLSSLDPHLGLTLLANLL